MGKCKKESRKSDQHVSSLKNSKPIVPIECNHSSVTVLQDTDDNSSIGRNMRLKIVKNDAQSKRVQNEVNDMLMDSSEHTAVNTSFIISEETQISSVTNVSHSAIGKGRCDKNTAVLNHVYSRTRKQLKHEPAVHLEKLDRIPMHVSVDEKKNGDEKSDIFVEDRSRNSCQSNLQGVKVSSADIKLKSAISWPTTAEPIFTLEAPCAGNSVYNMCGALRHVMMANDITKTSDVLHDKNVTSSFGNHDMQLEGVEKDGDMKSTSAPTMCEKHTSRKNNLFSQKMHGRVKLCKQESHEINDTSIVQDFGKSNLQNEKKGCQSLGVTGDIQLSQSIRDKSSKAEAIEVITNRVTGVAMHESGLFCTDSVDDLIPSKMSKLSQSSKRDIKYAKNKTKLKTSTVSHSDSVPTTLTRSKVKLPWLNSAPMTELVSKRSRKHENEVWLNRRLEQQACMLWSSEQKRRFQQQYPDTSNEWLEEKMRNHWEAQSDRDRLRYIQRARQATQLEHNRQLGRRCLTQQQLSKDDYLSSEAVLTQRLQHCTAIQLKHLFHAGTAQHQYDIIQHKLWSLQRRLFTADYRLLGRYLYSRLLLAMAAGDADTQPCSKTEKIGGDAWLRRIEESGRLIIYSAIEELEASVDGVVNERFLSLQKQAALQYRSLLIDIIDDPKQGNPMVLDDQTTSSRLGQLLDDLLQVDNDNLYKADSLTADDRAAIATLQRELSNGWVAGSTNISVDGQQVTVPEISCSSFQKLLLYEASQRPTVIQLLPDDVEACLGVVGSSGPQKANLPSPVATVASIASDVRLLEAAGHVYRMLHGVELCCGLDSPSCVLSCLLVIDRLDRQSLSTASKMSFQSSNKPPAPSQSWSDEKMLNGRVTVDEESGAISEAVTLSGACSKNDHGIYGIDTWLTSPIESSSLPTTGGGNQNAVVGCELNNDVHSEHWLLQSDEFNYMSMMHDGSSTDIGVAL